MVSDRVLKGGGFKERIKEGPKRSVMYAESEYRYSGDGHARNPLSDMQLGSLWGGGGVSYFLKGGFAKRGVRTNPPNVPWLRACQSLTKHSDI